MCRVPGHKNEWKDYYLNPMSKKIKEEANQIISDGDSSECSSEEYVRVVRNEDDADSETEDCCNFMPELIVRNRDPDEASMDSDDGASASTKSMPKSLIRKKERRGNELGK